MMLKNTERDKYIVGASIADNGEIYVGEPK